MLRKLDIRRLQVAHLTCELLLYRTTLGSSKMIIQQYLPLLINL